MTSNNETSVQTLERISCALENYKKQKGLTYAEIGEKLGFSTSYVNRIVKRNRGTVQGPSTKFVTALSKLLGVSQEELLSGEARNANLQLHEEMVEAIAKLDMQAIVDLHNRMK